MIPPCKCGAPAVEQVRQDMGRGDYWQDRQDHPPPFPFGNIVPQRDGTAKRVPFHTLVELDDASRNDRRIACTKCSKSTGWSKGGKQDLIAAWRDKCVV